MPVTNYIWDEVNDTLLMEKDEDGNTMASYTYEPGRYGPLISQHRGGQSSYYQFDGQGSTRQLTDANRNVTDSAVYTAFGETVACSGTTTNPFGFQGALGYYMNPEMKDVYVRARFFQPRIGRWLSVDPLLNRRGPDRYTVHRQAGGENAYVFARANPVGYVDFEGMLSVARAGNRSEWWCGEFAVRMRFKLSKAYRNRTASGSDAYLRGYIVQKVQIWELNKRCPSNASDMIPYEDRPLRSPDVVFFEAWPVIADGVRDKASDLSSRPASLDRWGYYRAHGEARFYPEEAVFLKGVGVVPGTSCLELGGDGTWGPGLVKPYAGRLASSWIEPSWWRQRPLEGPVFRVTAADRDCCCKPWQNDSWYLLGVER